MTTLSRMLRTSIDRRGDAPALADGITAVSYADLGERVEAVARHLAATGVGAGDRVAFSMPNAVEFADWYYGTLRAGGVAVPLNPTLRAGEVEAQLRHSGASLLVAWPGIDAAVEGARAAAVPAVVVTPGSGPTGYLDHATEPTDLPERDADDLAVLLFTSGTTSTPKAAMLSHRNLVENARVCAETVGIVPDDVMLGSLPLFHAFGQTVCLNVMMSAGGRTVMQPQFNPREALALVEASKATCMVAVPAMFTALGFVKGRDPDAYDLRTLNWGISGGAPLPPETYSRLTAALGIPIFEGYGLSEASPVVALNQGEANRPGSVGTALPGLTLGLVDPQTGEPVTDGEVGELTVAGPSVMQGYWNDPDATAAVLSPDGVLRTGDMARIGDDGYVEIVDRRKDLVIVGGENVYPREVEDVLVAHPAVSECAVLGVPDDVRGEVVVAAVVLQDGAAATEAELRAHVRAHLASFKVPRRIWFPDALPLGGTGKVLKRAIPIPDDVRARP